MSHLEWVGKYKLNGQILSLCNNADKIDFCSKKILSDTRAMLKARILNRQEKYFFL